MIAQDDQRLQGRLYAEMGDLYDSLSGAVDPQAIEQMIITLRTRKKALPSTDPAREVVVARAIDDDVERLHRIRTMAMVYPASTVPALFVWTFVAMAYLSVVGVA